MNKILIGLIMAGSLTISGMAAEKSGAFVGVDLGVSIMKTKITPSELVYDPLNEITIAYNDGNAIGLMYGLKGGYKHFINDNFGVRGYVYLSNASGKTKAKDDLDAIKIGTMNYGVGADALYNFMDNFGAFAGISLGATGYSITYDEKNTITKFNTAINLGVRIGSIELGVSMPTANLKEKDEIATMKIKTQAEIKASYIFNF